MLACNTAQADIVTIDGSLFNSDFDVTYDDELVGLFGTPILSNNVIAFLPSEFSATSTDGSGLGFTNSTIQLTLTPNSDSIFSEFSLVERGDYILTGDNASVQLNGQIRARNISDVLNESVSNITADAPLTTPGLNNWQATAFIDAATGDWQPTDSAVLLTIENILIASTQDYGELAFIEKKFAASPIELEVTVVPVPGALVLLASGLALFGFRMRRFK